MNQICNLSTMHQTLSLVSDASVQKNHNSGFAWTNAHHKTILWQGVGLALGNASDMYSG